MPADTRAKRFSLMSMGRPFVRTLPARDGTLAEIDRRLLALLYGAVLVVETFPTRMGARFANPGRPQATTANPGRPKATVSG